MSNIKFIEMKHLLIVLFIILVASCDAQTCKTLKEDFTSYENAISKVRSTEFVYQDQIDIIDSSWLIYAEYYSCDNQIGYFIITTNTNKSYIHKNLPFNVWSEFKKSLSKGSFYNQNIRYRYPLKIY